MSIRVVLQEASLQRHLRYVGLGRLALLMSAAPSDDGTRDRGAWPFSVPCVVDRSVEWPGRGGRLGKVVVGQALGKVDVGHCSFDVGGMLTSPLSCMATSRYYVVMVMMTTVLSQHPYTYIGVRSI